MDTQFAQELAEFIHSNENEKEIYRKMANMACAADRLDINFYFQLTFLFEEVVF